MIDKHDSIRMSWRSSALVGPQFWKSCCRTHLRHALVCSPLYLEIFCDAQIHLAGDERVRGDCCVEVFQLCWSCPTCAIPANVPRSGSVRQPASSGFCVTRCLQKAHGLLLGLVSDQCLCSSIVTSWTLPPTGKAIDGRMNVVREGAMNVVLEWFKRIS